MNKPREQNVKLLYVGLLTAFGLAACNETAITPAVNYHRLGMVAGKADRAANLPKAHRRHSDEYDATYDYLYRNGYDEGYASKR